MGSTLQIAYSKSFFGASLEKAEDARDRFFKAHPKSGGLTKVIVSAGVALAAIPLGTFALIEGIAKTALGVFVWIAAQFDSSRTIEKFYQKNYSGSFSTGLSTFFSSWKVAIVAWKINSPLLVTSKGPSLMAPVRVLSETFQNTFTGALALLIEARDLVARKKRMNLFVKVGINVGIAIGSLPLALLAVIEGVVRASIGVFVLIGAKISRSKDLEAFYQRHFKKALPAAFHGITKFCKLFFLGLLVNRPIHNSEKSSGEWLLSIVRATALKDKVAAARLLKDIKTMKDEEVKSLVVEMVESIERALPLIEERFPNKAQRMLAMPGVRGIPGEVRKSIQKELTPKLCRQILSLFLIGLELSSEKMNFTRAFTKIATAAHMKGGFSLLSLASRPYMKKFLEKVNDVHPEKLLGKACFAKEFKGAASKLIGLLQEMEVSSVEKVLVIAEKAIPSDEDLKNLIFAHFDSKIAYLKGKGSKKTKIVRAIESCKRYKRAIKRIDSDLIREFLEVAIHSGIPIRAAWENEVQKTYTRLCKKRGSPKEFLTKLSEFLGSRQKEISRIASELSPDAFKALVGFGVDVFMKKASSQEKTRVKELSKKALQEVSDLLLNHLVPLISGFLERIAPISDQASPEVNHVGAEYLMENREKLSLMVERLSDESTKEISILALDHIASTLKEGSSLMIIITALKRSLENPMVSKGLGDLIRLLIDRAPILAKLMERESDGFKDKFMMCILQLQYPQCALGPMAVKFRDVYTELVLRALASKRFQGFSADFFAKLRECVHYLQKQNPEAFTRALFVNPDAGDARLNPEEGMGEFVNEMMQMITAIPPDSVAFLLDSAEGVLRGLEEKFKEKSQRPPVPRPPRTEAAIPAKGESSPSWLETGVMRALPRARVRS